MVFIRAVGSDYRIIIFLGFFLFIILGGKMLCFDQNAFSLWRVNGFSVNDVNIVH
jgi:hypothetical protein